MSGYKEFEGKTLDDAIQDACSFYDATREKLEIEILNDAKGGIFGLVGGKKARIRARLVHLGSVLEGLEGSTNGRQKQKKRSESFLDDSLPDPAPDTREEQPAEARSIADEQPRRAQGRQPRKGQARNGEAGPAGHAEGEPAPASAPQEARTGHKDRGHQEGRQRRQKSPDAPKRPGNGAGNGQARPEAENGLGDIADMDADDLRRVPFDELDTAELENVTREVLSRLTTPFLGEASVSVTIEDDRVRVSISGVEDPGLLIGRDGQTLASLQYLATRMVSNRMKALLRVQIDAGDYRERQDERLRDLALSLAEKVKAGGRPQVTRPLSSYHRRVIHLTLQDDPLIQTHSKGEGEMKRVMIARRKPDKNI